MREYDYSRPGGYFVTVCTAEKRALFGEIIADEMRMNNAGRIVESEWFRTGVVRPNLMLDAFVIMPNHIHGIIIISDDGTATARATRRVAPTMASGSLGAIIGQFKSVVTKRINQLRGTPAAYVWQRNYYEHVIRNEDELSRIRQYIVTKPLQWALDRENPDRVGGNPEEDWVYRGSI